MAIQYNTLSIRQLWDKAETIEFDSNRLIKRDAFPRLIKSMDTGKVEVIYGPRQSGKTTLLMFLIDYLNRSGVPAENIWYVNLDMITDYTPFDNAQQFLFQFESAMRRGRTYLFIDEVHRLKNPGLFLKGLYDSRKDIKVFVSGSASFEIKAKVKEFLTGRKKVHQILPLSLREIIASRGLFPVDLLNKKLEPGSMEEWVDAQRMFGKYLDDELEKVTAYGCYPAVYSASNSENKLEELYDIFNTYLKKDIFDYFRIDRPEVFNNLVKLVSNQVGNVMNVTELCSTLSSARNTVERYLDILRDTFITSTLTPFTTNRRNEVRYAGKIFFIDLGIKNLAQKNISPVSGRADAGSVIENLVFSEMLKNMELLDEIHYWRTKSKAEVDFVYSKANQAVPIEIKTGSARVGTLTRSFHSFLDTFSPPKAIFVNRDKFAHIKVQDTDVFYIPIPWFLLGGVDLVL